MHRDDNSKYLLYIEPRKEDMSIHPIEDEYVKAMTCLMSLADVGAATYRDIDDICGNFRCGDAYKGFHITDCGKFSTNRDYLLPGGYITNSLSVYYLQYYRSSISENDWVKLRDILRLYKQIKAFAHIS